MVHIKDGLHRPVGPVSVFQNILVFLLLTHFCGGWSQEIGPPPPVIGMVGDDVVLPCQLEPPVDAVSMTMEWGRPDLEPRFVHVWHGGQELLTDQNEAYKGRASLSVNKLKHGDISLRLSTVMLSDNGRYRCYIPKLSKDYFVELLVGAVSSPAISLAGLHKASSGVVLDCESRGWYPEPEVLWLDGEGNLLSAGPTETVRGPDHLYTVSSRVTVEKRHSNSFTCRVQQRTINQTRETHITVPEDFFMAQSSCTASIAFSTLFGFMFVLAGLGLVWKWRQINTHLKTNNEEEAKKTTGFNDTPQQPLMEADRRREQLMTERQTMEDELVKKEEEQNDMTQLIDTLTELKKELEEQKEKILVQMKEVEKLVEENEKKVKSVEKDETANKGQGLKDLKELITENNWNLQYRKKDLQSLNMNLEKLSKKTTDDLNRLKERKKKVENHTEQVKKQLEELQRSFRERREDNMTKPILNMKAS
ncbi:butyrophilin subfamily 3 member A2-like [Cebidichthys violaceus]|uniref:butyrophilin subfamily 3 member A2-like n=1 Tax=Cebidichthys violaceus TaxID=271503 RepID=UPI0035CA3E24